MKKNIMKKVFIFDLDDTLFDTTNQLDITYKNLEKIIIFDGVIDLLEKIKRKGHDLYLVSCGDVSIQKKKIAVLKIADFFEKIFVVDTPYEKEEVFAEIVSKNNFLDLKNFFVIGDRLDSEIFFANKLGLKSVRVKQGKRHSQSPTNPLEIPDVEIKSISDLVIYV